MLCGCVYLCGGFGGFGENQQPEIGKASQPHHQTECDCQTRPQSLKRCRVSNNVKLQKKKKKKKREREREETKMGKKEKEEVNRDVKVER